ncbi:unnamed protein product [Danaus chrysippus]|uniref:(African queen) hypothetical protein n=1 Tax=Danaus chrysippus TaxID=151541 RepID=A0A8J2QPP2_9NEOP|nr:unnamed protein product [Danaus chrysippus]
MLYNPYHQKLVPIVTKSEPEDTVEGHKERYTSSNSIMSHASRRRHDSDNDPTCRIHISFKSLIERNKEAENKGIKPSPSSAIHLPFIVVNTSDKALIDCSISNDKTEYMFNFNKRFQIHDDIDILKRMGLLYEMGRGTSNALAEILDDEDVDELGADEEALEGEAEGEEQERW